MDNIYKTAPDNNFPVHMQSKPIWGAAVKGIALLCWLFSLGTVVQAQSRGQTVVLNLKRTETALADAGLAGSIIINGPTIRGASAGAPPLDNPAARDSFDQLALNLITIRLADQGLLKLSDLVGHLVREDYDTPPWRRALRVYNLMNGSAGFAYVPPDYLEQLDKQHLPGLWLEARAAGIMVGHEPAGLYLLMRVAEAVSGKSLSVLIRDELITPLGLTPADIRLADSFIPNMQFSNMAMARLVQLLIRNRDQNYQPYLEPIAHKILTREPVWAFLPTGPRRIQGLAEISLGGARVLASPKILPAKRGERVHSGAIIAALPEQNIAFVLPAGADIQALTPVLQTIAPATGNIADRWLAAARELPEAPPTKSARFIRDVAPFATLADRMPLTNNPLVLTPIGQGALELASNNKRISFTRTAPFTYESADGNRLLLAPDNLFKQFILDGVPYRAVRWAAEPWTKPLYAALASLALLTLLIYWRTDLDPRYRCMARLAPLGLLLTWAGTGLDLWLYNQFIFVQHWPWLIIIWRLAMLVGLAMIAAIPTYIFLLTRESELLPLKIRFAVQMHFLLILPAALLFIAIHVAWGLAPDIIPVW